jgi:CRP/FNR family transcriptional regulator, cyclic AMP receptor protein
VLSRNIRIEEDLVDELFNSTEKVRTHSSITCQVTVSKTNPSGYCQSLSQETMAEMTGATCTRVNLFMNKFIMEPGFIKYNGGVQIDASLLSIELPE